MNAKVPVRLDVHLVAEGLARSRGQARDLVRSGVVRLDGRVMQRASRMVPPGARVEVDSDGAARWVGRAALKLLAAFEAFELDVQGAHCVDVGASTGGFTQVLLERGATDVVAIDVGHDQLAPLLRQDERVRDLSGHNIREVDADQVGAPFDFLVADLSFISLTLVLDRLRALLSDTGNGVLLVKPQFEVGRSGLGKSGVVTSAKNRKQALANVTEAALAAGLYPYDLIASPTPGNTGNREYLLWVSAVQRPVQVAALVAAVTSQEDS
ncbi:TlyA family RNA methyltransferase [Gephyromycinifex aptenodytis]|uniref:TlyA family RNA methyltransferase n=1 Tax=Gephyromycinifex aptenodytis TaxID=2716227 RepID=UPI001D0347B1|nr:TlyA family RNA methyltransferase [Gephyromycinifex aptenodytis]